MILLLGAIAGEAQENRPTLETLRKSAGERLRGAVDDRLLRSLGDADSRIAQRFLEDFGQRLRGTNVYDLAPLQDPARKLLPVLERAAETRPYAVWLRSHLDDFAVAEELRRRAPPPRPKPDAPPPPPPTAAAQRAAWNKQLENRPPPPRAQTYVPRLKPIFSAGSVPPALVWLAEVESSFDPQARSPAGAVGLFQFMPATARSLDLALSPEDERLDPDKSARAAARYLRHLHRRFGDWRLALAAYNAGETRVQSLLSQEKSRSFDGIAHRLPAETQMYVPKMEATLKRREGLSLDNMPVPRN